MHPLTNARPPDLTRVSSAFQSHCLSIFIFFFKNDDDDDDDTQRDSQSDPPSFQMTNNAGGQKEYRTTDEGGYDPNLYRDLPVSSEIKELFTCIDKYFMTRSLF